MKRILQQFFKYPWLTGHLVVASFFIALLSLATSLFVIQVLNRFISHGVTGTLITLVTGTLVAVVFEMMFRSLRRQLIATQNASQNSVVAIKAFEVLLQAQVTFLDRLSVGQRNEILRGVDTLRAATMPQNIAAILDVPFALLFVFVLWLLSPSLALISVIAMVSSVILAWRMQLTTKEEAEKLQRMVAERSGILGAAVSAAETIRVFNGSFLLMKAWVNADREVKSLRSRAANTRDYLQSKFGLVNSLQTVSIVSVGALQVVSGELTIGAMIGANILAGRALMPVSRVIQMGEAFVAAEQAEERLQDFIKLPLERLKGTALGHYDGVVEFKDLAFVYPKVSVLLFESLNLRLESGKTALIVGPNGSGKTTLIRLLMGLIEPSRGQILVGGIDLKQIALPWWRKQVSYLPQEPVLVTGTLKENISLANPEINDARLNEIIHMAALRPFLANSSDGLTMEISEGGRYLALGIRRRIALARALATNGNLFIADEPTEGLDDEGRRAVYKVFQQLRKEGKTIVVVSHDESFLQIADFRIDLGEKPVPNVQPRKWENSRSKDAVSEINKR
ncbi:MAG: ATP-binding cassette domain-containing protein [Methylococcales bacterium]